MATIRNRGKTTGKSSTKTSFDQKVDELEERLKERISVKTGFADPEKCARQMEQWFKFFDANQSGHIDYLEFAAALTNKFNFVGVQREIEALFNKYDEDASGTVDYKEFSYHIFGLGGKPKLDIHSADIVEKVKARILHAGGAEGIHGITRMVARMDHDGSQSVDREELERGLREYYGIDDISPREMQKLFDYFDKDQSGRISSWEFLKGLKTGMSYERKQIVREAFRKLDRRSNGYVTVEDILELYDTTTMSSVAGGRLTPEEGAMQLMAHFEQGNSRNGIVTWQEFLDYYRGISLGIEDDEFFELMIRNAWHLGGHGTTNKRVLVVHSDGRQETVVLDDLGIDHTDGMEVIAQLKRQGIRDIADIRL